MPDKARAQEPTYINMIAGGISGAASKTATAPLARLTILYQIQSFNKTTPTTHPLMLPVRTPSSPPSLPRDHQPRVSGLHLTCSSHPRATPHPYLCRPAPPPHPPSLTQALRGLVASEGLAALWRGNLATIIHRLPYSATNFAVFEAANKGLVPHMRSDIGRRLAAGATSGLVACTVAYPLDLVRTRLSAQRGNGTLHPTPFTPSPMAYNLPVRQGGGSGGGGSTSSTSSTSTSTSTSSSGRALGTSSSATRSAVCSDNGGCSSSSTRGGAARELACCSSRGSSGAGHEASNGGAMVGKKGGRAQPSHWADEHGRVLQRQSCSPQHGTSHGTCQPPRIQPVKAPARCTASQPPFCTLYPPAGPAPHSQPMPGGGSGGGMGRPSAPAQLPQSPLLLRPTHLASRSHPRASAPYPLHHSPPGPIQAPQPTLQPHASPPRRMHAPSNLLATPSATPSPPSPAHHHSGLNSRPLFALIHPATPFRPPLLSPPKVPWVPNSPCPQPIPPLQHPQPNPTHTCPPPHSSPPLPPRPAQHRPAAMAAAPYTAPRVNVPATPPPRPSLACGSSVRAPAALPPSLARSCMRPPTVPQPCAASAWGLTGAAACPGKPSPSSALLRPPRLTWHTGLTHRCTAAAAATATLRRPIAAAAAAPFTAAFCTTSLHPPSPAAPHYRGIVHALSHIVQHEGVLGLYRGLGATLLQATPSLALNFALYDSFKEAWLRHISPLHLDLDSGISHLFGVDGQRGAAGDARGSSCSSGGGGRSTSSAGSSQSRSPTALPAARHMTASSSLACGAAAGFCSSTLTYPLDLIRRRVQVMDLQSGGSKRNAISEYISVWRQVYLANGARGFYAGIATEYAKVLPGMAIAFTIYEGSKELLKNAASG